MSWRATVKEVTVPTSESQRLHTFTSWSLSQSFPSECPMSGGAGKGPAHQAGLHYGTDHAGKFVDINPLNQEAFPNQKPSPDQPFPLATERQVSPVPSLLSSQLLICRPKTWKCSAKVVGKHSKEEELSHGAVHSSKSHSSCSADTHNFSSGRKDKC